MLDTLNSSQGDLPATRFYIAKVVANDDPDQKQRIKVHIPDVMTGSVEQLPWLLPITHPSFGGTSTSYVTVNVPHVDSLVVVLFQDGNLSYGLTMGSVPIGGQVLGPLATNYPKRYGFVDPAGNHLYVDTTDGQTDLEFRHNSGTLIHVDNSGNVNVKVVQSRTTTIDVDDTESVGRDSSTSIGRDASTTIKRNETRITEGSKTVRVSGHEQYVNERNVTDTIQGAMDTTVVGPETRINKSLFSHDVTSDARMTYRSNVIIAVTGAVGVTVQGGLTATVNGPVKVSTNSDIDMFSAANIRMRANGHIVTEAAQWTHTGPVYLNGDVVVGHSFTSNGLITGLYGMNMYENAFFGSNVTVTTDIFNMGRTFRTHQHVVTGFGLSFPTY